MPYGYQVLTTKPRLVESSVTDKMASSRGERSPRQRPLRCAWEAAAGGAVRPAAPRPAPHTPAALHAFHPPPLQTTFLKPFSAGLWFMIVGFLLFAGLLIYFVEAPYPGSEFNR